MTVLRATVVNLYQDTLSNFFYHVVSLFSNVVSLSVLTRCFGRGAKFSVARAPQTEGAPQPCAAVRPAANSSRTWHALRASTCTQAQLQARHRCCSFVCDTPKVLETRQVMICKERASVVPSCVVMKHFDEYNSAPRMNGLNTHQLRTPITNHPHDATRHASTHNGKRRARRQANASATGRRGECPLNEDVRGPRKVGLI